MLDSRVPKWTKVMPLLAVVYVLSPIDIIPDFLVGPGQLDDIGVLLFAMYVFLGVASKKITSTHGSGVYDSDGKVDKKKNKVFEEGEFEEI